MEAAVAPLPAARKSRTAPSAVANPPRPASCGESLIFDAAESPTDRPPPDRQRDGRDRPRRRRPPPPGAPRPAASPGSAPAPHGTARGAQRDGMARRSSAARDSNRDTGRTNLRTGDTPAPRSAAQRPCPPTWRGWTRDAGRAKRRSVDPRPCGPPRARRCHLRALTLFARPPATLIYRATRPRDTSPRRPTDPPGPLLASRPGSVFASGEDLERGRT